MRVFFASHWDAYRRRHICRSCMSTCTWEENKSSPLSILQIPDQTSALSEAVIDKFQVRNMAKNVTAIAAQVPEGDIYDTE